MDNNFRSGFEKISMYYGYSERILRGPKVVMDDGVRSRMQTRSKKRHLGYGAGAVGLSAAIGSVIGGLARKAPVKGGILGGALGLGGVLLSRHKNKSIIDKAQQYSAEDSEILGLWSLTLRQQRERLLRTYMNHITSAKKNIDGFEVDDEER